MIVQQRRGGKSRKGDEDNGNHIGIVNTLETSKTIYPTTSTTIDSHKEGTHREQMLLEKKLCAWIEHVCSISLYELNEKMNQRVYEGCPLYYAIESGELLCHLLYKLHPSSIDIKQVNFFSYYPTGNLVQSAEEPIKKLEIDKTSNGFLSLINHNVDIFLASVKNMIGSAPGFTFNDIFLHRNKAAILNCLNKLMKEHTLAHIESTVHERRVEKEQSVPPAEISQEKKQKRKKSKVSMVKEAVKETVEQEMYDTDENVTFANDGLFKVLVAVYGFPFILIWMLISKLFLGK